MASDIEATGWIGGKELWERKADGGWVRAYSPQNKPTAEEIQVEPRFNTTIDLTGLSSDRYYPVWWRFPHNYGGANAWLTLHRTYSEDWEKKPFGEGVTHLAGLQLQIEGSEVAWGGDAQYLNIKRIRQTYRNTVKSIHYRMMSIARPIDDKYPLYEGVKSGDIVQSPVFSGCYLRGGLTYHVTSNFGGIHYSREEGEIEAHQSIQPHNKFEIKWMVKSYAIDDPLLGKEYNDTVLPYGHDYAETINLAKNAYPKTGGKIEGKVNVSSDIEATGWIGGKELWERKPDGDWVRAYTPQNKPSAADIGAFSITGGKLNGEINASNVVASQGDGRQHFALRDDDGRTRAWIYKDKDGDGVHINNGYDGGADWIFSNNAELYCPGTINSYLRNTIRHNGYGRVQFLHQDTNDYILLETTQDGKGIYFVQRNNENKNQWVLSFPQKDGTVATTDDIINSSNTPVGVPLPWPQANPPSGYLVCNGQSFNKETYPKLGLAYQSGKLPDLRGEFIRGLDSGRNVDSGRQILSWQNFAIQQHSHLIEINDAGSASSYVGRGNWQRQGNTKSGEFGENETRPRNIAFLYIVRAA
ncbi:phage tail protein [Xenorhabdus sp. KK7.4]|uniref:phage tail protein n=1 Tax=Xenorhabdus sp. KK7.4 TaxID=1851572 RepID=UPI000C047D20|nr:phage tail protein [Xenorhabdus sp. KK7.4]PHM55173.1 sulfurtransferase [Xenorhabdus sp. KK7.4]